MSDKLQAVVAGHFCFDVIPAFKKELVKESMADIFIPGKLINMDTVSVSTGGSVSNTGIAMQILGLNVELMACPGGCVTGGGQPIVDAKTYMTVDVKAQRAKALYAEDENATVRQSHKNPDMDILYKEYFEKPGSHKAHELLHTHYTKRDMF